MTGMDPAIEAVEAELRRREKQRDPGWSGNCFSDAVAVLAVARPHIEADLLARLREAVESQAVIERAHEVGLSIAKDQPGDLPETEYLGGGAIVYSILTSGFAAAVAAVRDERQGG